MKTAIGLALLLVVTACGNPAPSSTPTSALEPSDQAESSTTTNAPTTSSTYSIEVLRFAEENKLHPLEAFSILSGQAAQDEAYQRLRGIVGAGVIVSAAFGPHPEQAAEVTILVVDEEAVALVEGLLDEAGFDISKTFVEVAPEPEPHDPWEWLERDRYIGYNWLESPGPHFFAAWRLIESNGSPVESQLLAGFGTRWIIEVCESWLGDALTTSEGKVSITVTQENPVCDESTEAIKTDLLDVLEANDGLFEISGNGDLMNWVGANGGSLGWQIDKSFDEWLPVYPNNREAVLPRWIESVADDMEGTWKLSEVGQADPAAPVTLLVGVSTMALEGMCNRSQGMFALTVDDELGFSLLQTAMGCGDETGLVEEQINDAMFSETGLLQVTVNGATMTWSDERGPQLVWSR